MVRTMFFSKSSSLKAQVHNAERLVWMFKMDLGASLTLPRGATTSGSLSYSSCSQAKKSINWLRVMS